jgi:dynein heavy chain
MYYFIRTSNSKAISTSNVSSEVNFGAIDGSNGKLLDSVEKMLASVLLPALSNLDDWGSLKSRNNPHVQYFVEHLDQFISNINGLKNNMSNQVKLVNSDIDSNLSSLSTVSDYQTMSMNSEFLSQCEELLHNWCKQIAKVLAESEQIRREADDTGPYCK